jgi:hypothetical protein
MCRSIRTLHNFVPPATEEETRAAALQYVRKVAGFRSKPGPASDGSADSGAGRSLGTGPTEVPRDDTKRGRTGGRPGG